ncbi:hypothetical protein [Streptomyces sp. TP-A0874]|uniref:hypothetical protein n=1 Tax=Streptomyces sp. TP-A0874 TaxID=549819 RepID=UPI0008531DEF|nr:hypothetical protein [Streptomyces sp. TP-A0874]
MTQHSPRNGPRTAPRPLTLQERALVEEGSRKSALVWIQGGSGPARALWHVWHEGALYLVGDGPGEQPLADLGLSDGAPATVTLRSKDKGGRILVWAARVSELAPGGEAWQSAVAELRGKRLNAPDADRLTERWARECRVLRLEPTGVPERSGAAGTEPETGSLAAAPLPTPATTRRPLPAALPRLLLRRGKRGG